jgi:hypothetical protein
MTFSKKAIQFFLTLAIVGAWIDTLAGGIEASNTATLDVLIAIGSFLLYATAAIAVWVKPVAGKFLASWVFLFNFLIGIPFIIDFVWTVGWSAQVVEVARSMLVSGIFFVIAWRWKPNERVSVG